MKYENTKVIISIGALSEIMYRKVNIIFWFWAKEQNMNQFKIMIVLFKTFFNEVEKCKSISRLKLIYTLMITHPEEN